MFDVAPPSYGSDRRCKMNWYISARGKNFSPNFSFLPHLEWSHSPPAVALPVVAILPSLHHKSVSQCRSLAPPTPLHRSPELLPSHRLLAILPSLLHKSGLQRGSLTLPTPLHRSSAPHTPHYHSPAAIETAICFAGRPIPSLRLSFPTHMR